MITIIIGTNRPDSNSGKIAQELISLYKSQGSEASILNLKDLPAEIFQPGAYAEKPESFKCFSDTVLNASGLHVVTPEYNGGFPGVLKLFIDMLPFPESFEDRPVAFTGVAAGQFGALRPVEQLQQIFGYRNAYIYPNRVFVMNVFSSFDEEGLFNDEKIKGKLSDQAKGFAAFIDALK
ncbi:MAG TPA: NADPH-dependent oxidoreductase [Opitutae bacterium]|nr:NADPH-dependent oxidoreductase [Opitutae bacterium]